ncbi:MAG: MFS transporter, partial [bacterium]
MSQVTLLLSTFNVRPGEGRSVVLMLVHSFFMGISTVFFETAASALFLSKFPATFLPYSYMGAAIIITLTGVVYTWVKERTSFSKLMIGTIIFLLIFVCASQIGLWITDVGWIFFAILIWYRVLSVLTDLEYWAIAARLYDIRQSKRLYSLIGSGEVTARILGSFSVPFFVLWIGVGNLMLISVVGLVMCLVCLIITFKIFKENISTEQIVKKEEKKEVEPKPSVWREFLAHACNRYTALIFLLSVFGVFGKFFVDYAFLQQMQTRYNDANNLAGFFGIFSGAMQALNLIIRMFLSGRLLNRYGIKVGLQTLPFLHTLCTSAIVFVGTFYINELVLIFWLVITNQGFYKTIKHPIDYPSFKIMYQPLRSDQRLAAQIAVEAIVTPITTGLAGIIMWIFTLVIAYDPVIFS